MTHCTERYRSLPIKTGCQTVALCVLSKTVFSKRVSKDVHSETWNSSVFLLNWGQVHGERTQSVINQWVCIFHSLCTSLSFYIFNKYINNWVQTICWALAVLTLVLFLFLYSTNRKKKCHYGKTCRRLHPFFNLATYVKHVNFGFRIIGSEEEFKDFIQKMEVEAFPFNVITVIFFRDNDFLQLCLITDI